MVVKVSLKAAASGNAAKTTASRNAKGAIVGNSTGSKYVREQEAKAKIQTASRSSGNSSGSIQLKDDSYIPQIQPTGSKLDGNVKIYRSKASMIAAHNEQMKATVTLAKQQRAFRIVKDKDGKSIASIKTQGSGGHGEQGVRIVQYQGRVDENGVFHKTSSKVVAVSKNAQDYKSAERADAADKKASAKAEKYSITKQAKILYEAGKRISVGSELTKTQQAVVAKYSTTEDFKYSKLSELITKKGKNVTDYLSKVTRKDAAVAATEDIPVAGSVVKGGYDVVEIPAGVGEIAKGFERWAQKPKTIAPSIPIGAGIISKSVTSDPIRFATSLVLMEGIGRGVKKINPVHVRSTKLQEVSPGEAAAVRDIKLGYTVSVGKKPVVSYSKSAKKFQKGTLSADKKMLEGKQVQAFTKADTQAFEKTLKQFDKLEQDYFAAGKKIADTAYRQKSAITKPKELDILSEHVAADMKPIVKQTIMGYGSKTGRLTGRDIQVYGSVPQKLQMKGYFTRTPKDIEISVSSVDKFVSMFRKNATSKGFKEGVDYRVTGDAGAPKVEFMIEGKWEKGIEVFSHKKTSKSTTEAAEGVGYRSESGIAFGFKNMKSIKADSVKMMKLQEQTARKFAGGTTLKDGKIDLMHGGRVKDVRDLIEIGTAYELTKQVGIAKEVVQYAQIAAKRHPEILESPIVKYIVENGKLPTKSKVAELTSEGVKSVTDMGNAVKAGTGKELELMFEAKKFNVSKAVSREISRAKQAAPYTTANNFGRASAREETGKPEKVSSSRNTGKSEKMSVSKSKNTGKSKSTNIRASKTISKQTNKNQTSRSKSKTVEKSKVRSKATVRPKRLARPVKIASKEISVSKKLKKTTASKLTSASSKRTQSKASTSKASTSKQTNSKQTNSKKPYSKKITSKDSIARRTKFRLTKVSEYKPVPKALPKRRKRKQNMEPKNRGYIRGKRKVKNVLGSMKSVLG